MGGQSGMDSRPTADYRGRSTPAGIGRMSLKAVHDGSVMTIMRRQMECLEQKLSGHVTRIQQQSDQVSNAMRTRVDSKMELLEALTPKLDHRVSELSGTYEGLSQEMQTQIQRIDGMETHLWEWRCQLEEKIQARLVDSDVHLLRVQTGIHANDELQQVVDMDTQNSEVVVDREVNSRRCKGDTDSFSVECQLADHKKKIDHLMEMSLEMRERVQVREEAVKHLQSGLHDLHQHKLEQSDMLEVLKRILDSTEWTGDEPHSDELQAQLENIQDEMQLISERTKSVEDSNAFASRVGSFVTEVTRMVPKVIQQQKNIDEMTERLDQMDGQIKRLCADVGR